MRQVWQNQHNPNLSVERAYEWVDRVLIIDKSKGRLVVQDTKFSSFDFTDWELIEVK